MSITYKGKKWNPAPPEEETLLLWKRLKDTPSCFVDEFPNVFKNKILRKLGIGERRYGCPLCHTYKNQGGCPLGEENACWDGCMYTPYRYWHSRMMKEGYHDQDAAREFYEYLVKKFKGLDHEVADKLIKEHGELLTANCNMMHIIKENERRIEQILSELKFSK